MEGYGDHRHHPAPGLTSAPSSLGFAATAALDSAARPRTSSGTIQHTQTASVMLPLSTTDSVLTSGPLAAASADNQLQRQRPSLSHTASTLSTTMSRDGASTGQSSPHEDTTEPSADEPTTTVDNAQDQDRVAPPSKKKKGQRFFCTEFPPCSLSFTRSEHLARHIRKHTGERPFQCHCNRRFSRLDNLRQHAQTVHCNEPIPPDSLANTGSSRYARAARSERARKQSRAQQLGRGGNAVAAAAGNRHNRALSTSSISSVLSSYSQSGLDIRRRPPALSLSDDGLQRARLSLDAHPLSPRQGMPMSASSYHSQVSPTGAAVTGRSSFSPSAEGGYFPGPASSIPFWDHRRRMSVPVGGTSYPPPNLAPRHFSQMATSPEAQSAYPPPSAGSVHEDSRRRTWHPSQQHVTQYLAHSRPSTSSGLDRFWYSDLSEGPSQSPFHSLDYNMPTTKLPGIESFDQPPPPPATSREHQQHDGPHPSISTDRDDRRASTYPSPFEARSAGVLPYRPPPASLHHHRKSTLSFDAGIRSELVKLELTDRHAAATKEDVIGSPSSTGTQSEELPAKAGSATPVPTTHVTVTTSFTASTLQRSFGRDDYKKAPVVTATEISLPTKLDTNRLDVLVAVATGETIAG